MKPYYQDDLVTIYHGDAREIVLPDVDLVLTDPPYGVTYVSNSGSGKGTQPISNDGARLSLRLYRQVLPLLRTNHVLWFTRWDAWPDVWGELGQWFPLRGLLVWDKRTPGMGDLSHWGPSYELIASAGSGKIVGGRDGSILNFAGVPSYERDHPTEKPVGLLSYLIGKLAAASVLDPFMGAGSTLVAAKSLGVQSVGVEVEERYCEVAAERCRQVAMSLFLPPSADHSADQQLPLDPEEAA
jgi:DNA modification methylase